MTLYQKDFVMLNKFSRPDLPMVEMRGFVLHWTANKGATDENHAEYFDGADGGGGRFAGAHMFVDKDSATLIVDEHEGTFHANDRACKIAKLKASCKRKDGSIYYGNANLTTLGLEMCVEKDGTIHPNTIKRSVEIMAHWCKKYSKTEKDIYRHFDVTGKNCPAPFVEKPELFKKFKADVAKLISPVVPEHVAVFPYPNHTISRGSTATKYVILLQKQLGVKPDGIFGQKTEDAVKAYQKAHKLVVDGIVGKKTWNSIF